MHKTLKYLILCLLIIFIGIYGFGSAMYNQDQFNIGTHQTLPNVKDNQHTLRITSEENGFKILRQHIKSVNELIIQGASISPASQDFKLSFTKINNIKSIINFARQSKQGVKIWMEIDASASSQVDKSKLLTIPEFLQSAQELDFNGYLLSNAIPDKVFDNFNSSLERGYMVSTFNNISLLPSLSKYDNLFYAITPIQLTAESNKVSQKKIESIDTVVNQISQLIDKYPSKKINLIFQLESFLDTFNNQKLIWTQPVSYREIIGLIESKNLSIDYTDRSTLPSVNFLDKKYWLADASFIHNTLISFSNNPKTRNIKNFGISSALDFDPQSFIALDSDFNMANISNPYFSTQDVDISGVGSIYSINKDREAGERTFTTDTKGQIKSQIIKKYSKPAQIIKSGYLENRVTLTFDDGPDPINTPAILRILKEKNLKATFYLKGENVLAYPGIAKKIVDDGHIIGNHTYTHPDTNFISLDRLTDEVKYTDRQIQLATNTKTRLYRTPKHSTGFSELTEVDIVNLRHLISRGYTVIESDVDSFDFSGISADEIQANVFASLNKNSSQILFHDLNETKNNNLLVALPKIIDKIKSMNLEIVNTDSLLSLNQNIYKSNQLSEYEWLYQNALYFLYKDYWFAILLILIIDLVLIYL